MNTVNENTFRYIETLEKIIRLTKDKYMDLWEKDHDFSMFLRKINSKVVSYPYVAPEVENYWFNEIKTIMDSEEITQKEERIKQRGPPKRHIRHQFDYYDPTAYGQDEEYQKWAGITTKPLENTIRLVKEEDGKNSIIVNGVKYSFTCEPDVVIVPK